MKFFATLAVIGMMMIGGGWYLKQRHQAVAVQAIHAYGETCAHHGSTQNQIAGLYARMPTGDTFLWIGVVFVLAGGLGYGLLYADKKRKDHAIAMKAMEGSDE